MPTDASPEDLHRLSQTALEIRRDILRMTSAAGGGHPGGSLSMADLLTALVFHDLRLDPTRPEWPDRDRLVLSQGDAAPALYAALARRGYFPVEELASFRTLGSRLQGHVDRRRLPGIEASTGCPGQGIGMAVGFALDQRLRQGSSRVVALLGDGECQAGSTWEALLAGGHYRLDHLTVILDRNGSGTDGDTGSIPGIEPIVDQFRALRYETLDIDGHDFGQILGALTTARSTTGRPTAIVARTVKGKGVSFLEHPSAGHRQAPNPAEAEQALAELGATLSAVAEAKPPESLRDAYEQELLALGGEDPNLVVLDADRSGSTRTQLFGQRYPERFFPVGAMEPTMVTLASGLALSGRTVFASTFAVFAAGQAYNMVRQAVCFNHANVKIVATHGGLLVGGDGGTHQMLEDIALMRGLPGMTVIVPADGPTTRTATRAVTRFDGPAYLRLTRERLPVVTDGTFALGKAPELRAGGDLTLVAVGALVARALEVAEELHRVGVEARVLDFASIKPFDAPALLKAARETGAILTLEEHSVLSGLGALVASTTSENYPVPVRRVGVPDLFGESGDPWALMDQYGLSKERALEEAWELLRQRGKVN